MEVEENGVAQPAGIPTPLEIEKGLDILTKMAAKSFLAAFIVPEVINWIVLHLYIMAKQNSTNVLADTFRSTLALLLCNRSGYKIYADHLLAEEKYADRMSLFLPLYNFDILYVKEVQLPQFYQHRLEFLRIATFSLIFFENFDWIIQDQSRGVHSLATTNQNILKSLRDIFGFRNNALARFPWYKDLSVLLELSNQLHPIDLLALLLRAFALKEYTASHPLYELEFSKTLATNSVIVMPTSKKTVERKYAEEKARRRTKKEYLKLVRGKMPGSPCLPLARNRKEALAMYTQEYGRKISKSYYTPLFVKDRLEYFKIRPLVRGDGCLIFPKSKKSSVNLKSLARSRPHGGCFISTPIEKIVARQNHHIFKWIILNERLYFMMNEIKEKSPRIIEIID